MVQDIRDRNGQIIGQIRTSGERMDIYDMSGCKKGYFNGRSTYDMNGCKIGDGNLLIMLLK